MRTDFQIHTAVVAELGWDVRIQQKEIGVAVSDGVVTLSGVVASYAAKLAAGEAAERVVGVRAVANDLAVQISDETKRTDTELAHAVADALSWAIEVPAQRLTSQVSDGWVTLDGRVDWRYQRDAAVRAISRLKGVRGLNDKIVVVPPSVSVIELKESIKQALELRADRTADHVTIEATGGVVTLSGTVASYSDRRAIAGTAWSAPGVVEVNDQIEVAL